WWTFDGANLKTNVADSSGSGNNGSIIFGTLGNKATTTAVVIGKLGQAMKFDGRDDYVNGLSAPFGFADTTFTVSAWVNNSLSGGEYNVVSQGAGNNGGWTFQVNSGVYTSVIFKCGGKVVYTGRASLTTKNKWRHIVAVITTSTSDLNQNNATIYVDGVSMAVTTSVRTDVYYTSTSTDMWGIGIRGANTVYRASPFPGSIDDVRVYNRALSATEVKKLYNLSSDKINTVSTATAGGDTLKSGLVGWWTFDGANLKTNVADSSGTGNTGYLKGITATSSAVVPGRIGQALKLNGSTQYVDVSTLDSYPNGKATLSMSVWAKWSGTANNRNIVGWWNTDENRISLDSSNPGRVYIAFDKGATRVAVYSTLTNYNNNKWHHIVSVYDGAFVRLYIDGISAGTPTALTGNLFSGDKFNIGNISDSSSATWKFGGSIDDVRVYSRALSASEVKQLYNLGK
ncbi:MAG: LamG domain-containing protein, partial [Candidatus Saccharibacteria bacterium]|nr:LamG domain-containing protein [Candidatus Saccharibacteria bacterium]